MSAPVRVFCIDDNRLMAEALERWLALEPEFKWTGWVSETADAAGAIREVKPDIVMLDIDMPGGDSFDLAAILAADVPETRVVMFSGHVRVDYIDRALDVGAWGYVSKNESMETVLNALRRVAAGEFVLSPDVEQEHRRRQ